MAKMGIDKISGRVIVGVDAVPPKRYRIGELVRHTGLTRQTLHNYTRWGLITEAEWTPGGHRLYDESVFARLGEILRLKRSHTVGQMKTLFDARPAVLSSATGDPRPQEGGC